MIGSLVNCSAVAAGGLLGAYAGRYLPERIRTAMTAVLGLVCIGIGGVLMTRLDNLSVVGLAILLGTFSGECLNLEARLGRAISQVRTRLASAGRDDPAAGDFIFQFVTALMLFCASGMGVFGSFQEGMTGDSSILIAKGMLDFFTATIFASRLGVSVTLIAIPMFLVQNALMLLASLVVPLTQPHMLSDFTATGGMLMLATGLRFAGIKAYAVVNMLPALLLVMPISALWKLLF